MRVLNTEQLTVAHTGQNVSSAISKILYAWGVNQKVTTIVSDSRANIKNAVNKH